MNSRTRSLVVASLAVLGLGLGTGLVAYYMGFSERLRSGHPGPEELRYVPRDAALVASVDMHHVMTSELAQRMKSAAPRSEERRREFEKRTGVDIERDVDRVTAFLGSPPTAGTDAQPKGLIVAKGRFDEPKIESVLRQHGARVEEYRGKRIVVTDGLDGGQKPRDSSGTPDRRADAFALAFVEPGVALVGSTSLMRSAIDSGQGAANVLESAEMMDQIRSVEGANAWGVGRFDLLRSRAKLPGNIATQIPPVTWLSFSGDFSDGLRGILRADARDEEAANNLRGVVQGLLALARMQANSRPDLKAATESLQLGGAGKVVSLSFDVPASTFDTLGGEAPRLQKDGAR